MVKPTLFLSQKDIVQCISMEEIYKTVDEVFRAHGEGKVIMPAKITLDMKSAGIDSWINAMPSYVGPLDTAGIKWAGGFINNQKKGLPYVVATIIVNDPQTGLVLAVMDGAYITNVRTGGSAALTAKYTASKDSKVVAFIGSGMQAKMTLRALRFYFDIEEVRAADINPAAKEAFKAEMEKELDLTIVAAKSNQEAVEGADIIFTATQADEPLVMNEWIKKGATAVSLGSYQEFDEEFVLTADKIVVDDWAQCSHRGELKKLAERGQITQDNIYAEIGKIAAGQIPGRESEEERILAIPIGLGSHDLAVATKVYRRAVEKGLGMEFKFFDVK